MKVKAITKPYAFLTANGFTHHTAYRLTNGKPRTVSLRHLEKLCRILHCQPHDLLAYTPDANTVLPGTDHLAFLQKPDAELPDLQAIMSTLSPQQMVELSMEMAQRYRKAG
ncbi:MAG: helix-turn-helix transcriptional regulator [Flavobacteriales bacterium]|nr:helix-turn-helix transcriptional regulator [Flavobacteriales bacterium]